MQPRIYDAIGQLVRVGDRIAVAFAHSSAAKIRAGIVREISSSKPASHGMKTSQLMLHVEWEPNHFGKRVPKASRIEANNGRFVKIN